MRDKRVLSIILVLLYCFAQCKMLMSKCCVIHYCCLEFKFIFHNVFHFLCILRVYFIYLFIHTFHIPIYITCTFNFSSYKDLSFFMSTLKILQPVVILYFFGKYIYSTFRFIFELLMILKKILIIIISIIKQILFILIFLLIVVSRKN